MSFTLDVVNVLEPASGFIVPGINGIMGIAPLVYIFPCYCWLTVLFGITTSPNDDTAINNAFKQANYTASNGGNPVENVSIEPHYSFFLSCVTAA